MVEMLYHYNLLSYVKCSTSLLTLKAVAISLYRITECVIVTHYVLVWTVALPSPARMSLCGLWPSHPLLVCPCVDCGPPIPCSYVCPCVDCGPPIPCSYVPVWTVALPSHPARMLCGLWPSHRLSLCGLWPSHPLLVCPCVDCGPPIACSYVLVWTVALPSPARCPTFSPAD